MPRRFNEAITCIICCFIALTRGNADAQAKFVKLDGYTVLLKAMQSHIDKLQLKAVFLLMGMMQEDRKHKGNIYFA